MSGSGEPRLGAGPGAGEEVSSKLAAEAWESLFRAQVSLLRGLAADEAWSELPMRQYDVLYALSSSDRPLRLSELNEAVLLSQPSLSRMVDRLVAAGLVTKGTAPDDGRGVLVSLTRQGRTLQRRVGRGHAADIKRRLSVLTADELRTLTHLTDKLSEANRGGARPSGGAQSGPSASTDAGANTAAGANTDAGASTAANAGASTNTGANTAAPGTSEHAAKHAAAPEVRAVHRRTSRKEETT